MQVIQHYDFPGRLTSLRYSLPEAVNSLENITEIGLKAITQITGEYIRFFCADVELGFFDRELLYPSDDLPENKAHWLLKSKNIPANLICDQTFIIQNIVLMDNLEKSSLLNTIRFITQQNQPDYEGNNIILWKNISFKSVSVLLANTEREFIQIQKGNRFIEYPVEKKNGHSITYGPLINYALEPPLSISLNNSYGEDITLNLHFFWSYWTDKNMEGAHFMQKNIHSLQSEGWQIISSPNSPG
ncbi:MAG: hypothetical protein NW226_22965 [Microscillaceae bacterium]|nr:hypothetical protein [Microscillaceae bacterium]